MAPTSTRKAGPSATRSRRFSGHEQVVKLLVDKGAKS